MIYPEDPMGSFGPDYPKGFTKWYLVIVIALVVAGMAILGGCSARQPTFIALTKCDATGKIV